MFGAALEWSFGPHGDDEVATRLAAASTQVFLELSLLDRMPGWAERAIARLGDSTSRTPAGRWRSTHHYPLALMHTEANDQRVRTAFSARWTSRSNRETLAHELRLLSGLFMYSHWTMDIRWCDRYRHPEQETGFENAGSRRHGAGGIDAGAPPIIWREITSSHKSIAKRVSGYSGVRSALSTPDNTCFITLASCSSAWLVLCCTEGLLDQSLDYAKRAIEEGEKSGNPATLCRSLILVLPVFLAMADLQPVGAVHRAS